MLADACEYEMPGMRWQGSAGATHSNFDKRAVRVRMRTRRRGVNVAKFRVRTRVSAERVTSERGRERADVAVGRRGRIDRNIPEHHAPESSILDCFVGLQPPRLTTPTRFTITPPRSPPPRDGKRPSPTSGPLGEGKGWRCCAPA